MATQEEQFFDQLNGLVRRSNASEGFATEDEEFAQALKMHHARRNLPAAPLNPDFVQKLRQQLESEDLLTASTSLDRTKPARSFTSRLKQIFLGPMPAGGAVLAGFVVVTLGALLTLNQVRDEVAYSTAPLFSAPMPERAIPTAPQQLSKSAAPPQAARASREPQAGMAADQAFAPSMQAEVASERESAKSVQAPTRSLTLSADQLPPVALIQELLQKSIPFKVTHNFSDEKSSLIIEIDLATAAQKEALGQIEALQEYQPFDSRLVINLSNFGNSEK